VLGNAHGRGGEELHRPPRLSAEIFIARQNLDAQKHSAKLTRQRFEAGLASGLDVANAEAQVATTAALIPSLEASARQTIYSLSVLLASRLQRWSRSWHRL